MSLVLASVLSPYSTVVSTTDEPGPVRDIEIRRKPLPDTPFDQIDAWHLPTTLHDVHLLGLAPEAYEWREYGPQVPRDAYGNPDTPSFDATSETIFTVARAFELYFNLCLVCAFAFRCLLLLETTC